jgi:hypothetical protein
MASDGSHAEAAPLSFAGPVRLIAGEDATSYDEVLGRVTEAIKPGDVVEEIRAAAGASARSLPHKQSRRNWQNEPNSTEPRDL